MKIQINLYATLALQKTNRGTEAGLIEIEDGTSIGDILDRLGISRDVPKIIFLNGVHADLETIPKDGDRIAVFPPSQEGKKADKRGVRGAHSCNKTRAPRPSQRRILLSRFPDACVRVS